MAVAATPALTDRARALRTSGSCQATENHFSEYPAMGQLSMFDRLNA